MQLATVTAAGRPRIRTVVLRAFSASDARAEIHSDMRAEKIEEIAQRGDVSLLAWDAAAQLQLRFEGSARVHHRDTLARKRWDTLSLHARNAYGLGNHPGSRIADPDGQTNLPPEAQFEQFAVVAIALNSVDVLLLQPEGRQKRAFGRFSSSTFVAEWIGP